MKASRVIALLVAALFSVTLVAGVALAADKVIVKGKIKDYDISKRTVTVSTDNGKDMTFVIENDTALKKLDDRLLKGDEVKIKYVDEGGKMVIKGSNDMKGTKAGC